MIHNAHAPIASWLARRTADASSVGGAGRCTGRCRYPPRGLRMPRVPVEGIRPVPHGCPPTYFHPVARRTVYNTYLAAPIANRKTRCRKPRSTRTYPRQGTHYLRGGPTVIEAANQTQTRLVCANLNAGRQGSDPVTTSIRGPACTGVAAFCSLFSSVQLRSASWDEEAADSCGVAASTVRSSVTPPRLRPCTITCVMARLYYN
ncbi:hypothetical protein BD413DRAFT_165925 [Trametes elegans]|nr:hypothetical protein BD413DRAFT_165925 [Trametes elegans]